MAKDENPDEKKGKKQSGTSKVVFTKKLPAKIRDLISKLQQNYPFFAEMHEKEIEELLRQCENETFRDGEIIFEKVAGGDKFYLIVSGSVLIFPGNAEIRLEPEMYLARWRFSIARNVRRPPWRHPMPRSYPFTRRFFPRRCLPCAAR